MSRVSVDAGAFRMMLNILTRAAERHGERTLAEAANEIRATAEVIEPAPPASQESAGEAEFSTEGVKRVADRMRRDGQPILASALMDLAEQRDSLRDECERLREAAAEVVRISDRKHEAWDRLKAALSASGREGE